MLTYRSRQLGAGTEAGHLVAYRRIHASVGSKTPALAGSVVPWRSVPVRVLAHMKEPHDRFGQLLARVTCKCGAVREIWRAWSAGHRPTRR